MREEVKIKSLYKGNVLPAPFFPPNPKHSKFVIIYRCICYWRNGSVRRIRFAWPKSHRQNGTVYSFFNALFSVRTVFQSECVLNIFNMVISGMNTQFNT